MKKKKPDHGKPVCYMVAWEICILFCTARNAVLVGSMVFTHSIIMHKASTTNPIG